MAENKIKWQNINVMKTAMTLHSLNLLMKRQVVRLDYKKSTCSLLSKYRDMSMLKKILKNTFGKL